MTSSSVLSDTQAREIARWWSTAAFDLFAACGAIQPELAGDIAHRRSSARSTPSKAGVVMRDELDCLAAYVTFHGERGPRSGWRDMVACPACGFDSLTVQSNAEAPIPGAGSGRYASVYDDEGRPVGACPECDEELDARALLASLGKDGKA